MHGLHSGKHILNLSLQTLVFTQTANLYNEKNAKIKITATTHTAIAENHEK